MIESFKKTLEERLEIKKIWIKYYSNSLKHQIISEQVRAEYFKDKFLLKFLMLFYFLPSLLLKFTSKKIMTYKHDKLKKEVEIIREILKNEQENL